MNDVEKMKEVQDFFAKNKDTFPKEMTQQSLVYMVFLLLHSYELAETQALEICSTAVAVYIESKQDTDDNVIKH